MEYINVEPCELMQFISKIKIDVIYLKLNITATIQTSCYDDYDKLLITYIFELDGNEYQMWNTDQWLIDYVLDKYGFSKKQIII
jgi:hypothetical protein